jgi:undecaprenyl-diphosphatase
MSEQTEKKPIEKITEVAQVAQEAAQVETAPPRVRVYRALMFEVVLMLVVVAFGSLTFLVKTTPSFAIDLQITRALQSIHVPLFGMLMDIISWPGFPPQSMIITVLLIVALYGFGLHWEALTALIASVLSSGVNVFVKDLIQRPRPAAPLVNVIRSLTSYSFPSGHVMFYTVFFGFIWFLAFTLLKPSLKRSLLLVFFGSLVLLVGASRIYQGEHWASDVLGAYLLASLLLVVIIQIYRWGKTRFFVHQPVAATKPQDA